MTDWRTALLAGTLPLDHDPGAPANPAGWPGYDAQSAVSVSRGPVAGTEVVAAAWDFSVFGGSFGEGDATLLAVAVDTAIDRQVPLVTLIRSGGTRLQEGMTALVGIPRARLALRRLGEAGLAHVAVCDAPTTGGVWIGVGSSADLRVGVAGGTIGFAGPRVVEAVTGEPVPASSHTATAAYDAGLIDAVVRGDAVGEWLGATLRAVCGRTTAALPAPAPVDLPARSGREQVAAARARTLGGAGLLDALLEGAVPLRAPRGDTSVAAVVGRLAGGSVVGVALAADVGVRPTPDGFRLLTRAAGLADRLRIPLITLVDTPGAEPGPAAEADGVAGAIAAAMDAVVTCRSPSVAVLTGEGGSGGALAGATADRLLVGPDSYFGAIGPEGAAAALRIPAEEAADRMRITPGDLLGLGIADGAAPVPATPDADCAPLAALLSATLADLAATPAAVRERTRLQRWADPAPRALA